MRTRFTWKNDSFQHFLSTFFKQNLLFFAFNFMATSGPMYCEDCMNGVVTIPRSILVQWSSKWGLRKYIFFYNL